jgi:endoribonuclease Dicer
MALRAKDVGGEFFTPREYQVELFEHAIDNDSIILLPTGTGKTYIAVMLIKHMTPYLGPNKKTAVFIVNKIAVLEQQYIYINNCTSLNVGKWHDKDVTKQKEKFVKFVQENDVRMNLDFIR